MNYSTTKNEIEQCDICHKSCRPLSITDEDVVSSGFDPMESIMLMGRWGYWSENPNRDLQEHFCRMCQPCYEKVKKYIESIGGVVRVRNWHPSFQVTQDEKTE